MASGFPFHRGPGVLIRHQQDQVIHAADTFPMEAELRRIGASMFPWFGVRARKTDGAQTINASPSQLVTFNNDSTYGNYDTNELFTDSVFTSPDNCYVLVQAMLPFRIGTELDLLPTMTVELVHTPFNGAPVGYSQYTANQSTASSGGSPNRIPINFITSIRVGVGDTLSIKAYKTSSYNNYTIESHNQDGALLCITRQDWGAY